MIRRAAVKAMLEVASHFKPFPMEVKLLGIFLPLDPHAAVSEAELCSSFCVRIHVCINTVIVVFSVWLIALLLILAKLYTQIA